MESTISSTGLKSHLVLIGGGAMAAALALALFFYSYSVHTLSLADIPFLFLNQQQVTIEGRVVDCVPTKWLQPCYLGVQSNDGAYFVLTGDFDKREVIQLVDQGQFQVTGIFTSDILDQKESAADVVGSIEVTLITPT